MLVVSGATDQPNAQAQPTNRPGEERLYREMQERIRYLERQVEEEREARRRAHTLLARLMDRMPELEATSETPGSPEMVKEQQGRVSRPRWPRPAGGRMEALVEEGVW